MFMFVVAVVDHYDDSKVTLLIYYIEVIIIYIFIVLYNIYNI